ncbi:MAG: hypothetical protein AAB469_01830 [Patescibacteria group bacterium]
MKVLGFSLIGLGLSAVLVGAGTSDMKVAMGIPSLFDGLLVAAIGLVLFSAGALILADRDVI